MLPLLLAPPPLQLLPLLPLPGALLLLLPPPPPLLLPKPLPPWPQGPSLQSAAGACGLM
jgi:hypothetical protein